MTSIDELHGAWVRARDEAKAAQDREREALNDLRRAAVEDAKAKLLAQGIEVGTKVVIEGVLGGPYYLYGIDPGRDRIPRLIFSRPRKDGSMGRRIVHWYTVPGRGDVNQVKVRRADELSDGRP